MTARNTPKRDVTIPLCGKEDPIDGMLYSFADEVWSFMSFFTPRVPEWDDPVFEIHVPAPLLPGRLFPACRACRACRACALANGTEVPWRGRAGTLEVSSISHGASASSSVLGRPTFEPCINSSCSTMFLPYYRISFHHFLPLLLFSRRSLLPPVTHCRSFFPRSFVYRSSRPSTRS
jgi:hypothetical protein